MGFFSRRYAELAAATANDISPLLFFVAGLVGILQTNYEFVDWRGYEMVTIARNLVDHGAFANPFFAANTGPTANNPPLYPLFLAFLMKFLKLPLLVNGAALLGSIVANAITAALLPYVSFLFFGEVISGAAASLLWLGAMQPTPTWDTSYTLAGLLAFVLLTASGINKSEHVVRRGVLAGLVAGLLFLLNPSSLLVFLPWLFYLFLRRRAYAPYALKYCFVLLVAFCILPLVWAARNYRQLGAFVVRTNLGMTLYASNNDCAQSTLREELSSGCYKAHHANLSAKEAELVRSLGEVRYDHMRIADTKVWIFSHPGQFFRLTLTRIRDFWFPPAEKGSWYHAHFISIITVLSLPGLILMGYRRQPVMPFVLGVLVLYPLIYYIVVTDIRYRYPILWLSLLSAGYCVRQLLEVGKDRSSS